MTAVEMVDESVAGAETTVRRPGRLKHEYTHELTDHFVYLYRDPETYEIRYVGVGTRRGSGRQRPEDHLSCKQASCEVRPWATWLGRRDLSPIIEVIDCADRAGALALESALISALWTTSSSLRGGLLNHIHGTGEKFRPLGQPRALAGRRLKPRLDRAELAALGPALVVNLSMYDFPEYGEGADADRVVHIRPGAGTFSGLTDQRVADRVRQYWQVGNLREAWLDGSAPRPKMVVGITGPTGHKWVYGAMAIDWAAVPAMERLPGGLYSLPVRQPLNVDHRGLRGRVLAPYEFGPARNRNGRVFGSVRAHQFDWVC